MSVELEIVATGIATTIQDQGRAGLAHLGISRSGAVDRRLAAVVNRLVGNAVDAAVIETCGGLTLRATSAAMIATSNELAAVSLMSGEGVHVPGGHGRLWHYVAVRGGISVDPVLGSRSTDTLSGLGPALLAVGDRLPVGVDPRVPIVADHAPLPTLGSVARISPGPRLDWFDVGSFELLLERSLTILDSSRIGTRLSGVRLVRRHRHELPSEGLISGAIQVPPDSDPVMMLADHPTTGGYPVIAVVHPDDVTVVAQTAPGRTIRFIPG